MTEAPAGRGASTLALRFVSAAVLVPVALAAVWLGWPYLPAIVGLAGLGMAWEWGRLTSGGHFALREAVVMVAVILAVGAAAYRFPVSACAIAAAGAVAAGLAEARERLWTALGTLWISLGAIAFLWLALPPVGGRNTIIWLLSIVWASDIFAYLVGRTIGGARLAPRWSPNKTWAGAIGGLLGAAAVGAIAAAIGGGGTGLAVLISLVLGLASEAGDLAESVAKRHFSVKDASHLIPGHGGVLDRLDGLLAAAIAAALLTMILGPGALEIG